MTKDEAIRILEQSCPKRPQKLWSIKRKEAVAMAIESLSIDIVRCKDCKHRHLDGMTWNCPFGLSGGEDFFCAYGAKDGEADDKCRQV